MGEEEVERWIQGDETAKAMIARVLRERPLLLLPPLHRVPLRVDNVVEIAGASPSSKTNILIEAAVTCILPKEWNGVNYGGLEKLVMFFDLDCRFDISRLSQSLKHRIMGALGRETNAICDQRDIDASNYNMKQDTRFEYDKELFTVCMKRFLYVRCYDSLQFLASLKTLHYQLKKERESHGVAAQFLMYDGIGAFYWIDRSSTSLAVTSNNRKSHSLQNVWEAIVQETRKLMLVHPLLVFATKAAILGDKYSVNEAKWSSNKWSSENTSDLRTATNRPKTMPHREYMPAIWQSFVTHRVLVRTSDDDDKMSGSCPVYSSEWLLPSLKSSDKFVVTDSGISVVT